MISAPENVLLLSVDALRGDHLPHNGYDRETAPAIERLATESYSFTNAYSPSSHTREAIPALLTGRYPDEAIDDGYDLDVASIATHLRTEGFE